LLKHWPASIVVDEFEIAARYDDLQEIIVRKPCGGATIPHCAIAVLPPGLDDIIAPVNPVPDSPA
jgi:hypothetical protein